MSVQFKIEKFEGPLDLLLQLVEEESLPITDVSLAQITDQYLEYIEHSGTISKEELADFLLVAARLLLLKSRVLIPSLPEVEEQGFSLADQLRMYREFTQAAKRLETKIKLGQFLFPRERTPHSTAGVFSPPRGVSAERLSEVMKELIRAAVPVVRLPRAAVERAVTIQEKIAELRSGLGRGAMSFHAFVKGAQSKTEIVVTFLALLELVKQRVVDVSQESLFQDIRISSA